MKKFDTIIIGSGHNGLTTASFLAKKGRKVLVVEKNKTIGGLAASEEFHPGFKTAGILHDTSAVRRWVTDKLELQKFGLKFHKEHLPVFAPQRSGRGLLLWRDAKKALEEIGPHSDKDAKNYANYRAFLERITPFIAKVFDDFPPDVATMSFPGLWELAKKAVALRMLGRHDMMEILRIGPMCVADWLNEWFESDLLKTMICAPALYSTYTGPWSPGSNANLLIHECFAKEPVIGGPQALVKALEACARAAGVEIQTNTEVKQLVFDQGRVTGLRLADGSVLSASQVASAINPKTLFTKLVDPSELTMSFDDHVRGIRTRGTTGKIHLALSAYPEFAGRPSMKPEYIRTSEHFDEIEKAFDAIKYREISKIPALDIYVPTLEAPELAPAGKHVMSIMTHFAPRYLEGGWGEKGRADMYENTVAALEVYAPNIRSLIVGKEVLSPEDLEQRYGLDEGQLYHVEHAADQLLVRPTYECARYATPFPGLFLCGSGSHPGGGITCAPGALAVDAMI